MVIRHAKIETKIEYDLVLLCRLFSHASNQHYVACSCLQIFFCSFGYLILCVYDLIEKIMGIRGLSTFIHENPDFLKPHKLYDSFVVVDGDNLLHYLYFTNKINVICGGDYNK